MTTTITIKNLKNITELVFKIPAPGTYLLTAINGAGKTSLLTCINRLKNPNAFQKGFKSSSHKSLDSYIGSSVVYNINNDTVTYKYKGERWAPTPRKGNDILANCGYPEIIYITADADRVEPRKEEFEPKRVRLTEQKLRDSLNFVFQTTRFNELCHINLTRGGQTKAYVIRQYKDGKPVYFSEKNFSLGELCVLKLLITLNQVPNKSLLLIDELELATHPSAQANLFSFLEKISREKELTIIFSTHSVTLIKKSPRKKILFLENDQGYIKTLEGCYPAYALGQIGSGEEITPATIIYVEDDSAKKCVESMLDIYKVEVQGKTQLPTVLTIPLGGFNQILDFLDRSPQIVPNTTKITVLLDEDVKSESLENYKLTNDHPKLHQFEQHKVKLNYLPWTPEQGAVILFSENKKESEQLIQNYFSDQRFKIPANWPETKVSEKTKICRDNSKKELYKLCELIQSLTGKNPDKVRSGLFEILVTQEHANKKSIVQLIGSMIHS